MRRVPLTLGRTAGTAALSLGLTLGLARTAFAAEALSGAVQKQPTNWTAIVMFLVFGRGDVPAHVANGRALLINDYAASPLQARPPSLVAGAKRAA